MPPSPPPQNRYGSIQKRRWQQQASDSNMKLLHFLPLESVTSDGGAAPPAAAAAAFAAAAGAAAASAPRGGAKAGGAGGGNAGLPGGGRVASTSAPVYRRLASVGHDKAPVSFNDQRLERWLLFQ